MMSCCTWTQQKSDEWLSYSKNHTSWIQHYPLNHCLNHILFCSALTICNNTKSALYLLFRHLFIDSQKMRWVPAERVTTGGTPKPNIHSTQPRAVKVSLIWKYTLLYHCFYEDDSVRLCVNAMDVTWRWLCCKSKCVLTLKQDGGGWCVHIIRLCYGANFKARVLRAL